VVVEDQRVAERVTGAGGPDRGAGAVVGDRLVADRAARVAVLPFVVHDTLLGRRPVP
jgi:hypothetical protein